MRFVRSSRRLQKERPMTVQMILKKPSVRLSWTCLSNVLLKINVTGVADCSDEKQFNNRTADGAIRPRCWFCCPQLPKQQKPKVTSDASVSRASRSAFRRNQIWWKTPSTPFLWSYKPASLPRDCLTGCRCDSHETNIGSRYGRHKDAIDRHCHIQHLAQAAAGVPGAPGQHR